MVNPESVGTLFTLLLGIIRLFQCHQTKMPNKKKPPKSSENL
jgi:hypothetical protein